MKGRTGIFECLVVDETIRKLIMARASAEEIRGRARAMGMQTLYEHGEDKIQEGITTREEVERVIHQDEL